MANTKRVENEEDIEDDDDMCESGEDEEEEEEVEDNEEDDEDDSDFDFDALADKAVNSLRPGSGPSDLNELSLDVGLGPEMLYLHGGSNGSTPSVFDTSVVPGDQSGLDIKDFSLQDAAKLPSSQSSVREVRGGRVAPLDDSKERKKQAKDRAKDQLDKWFGLQRQNMTPELEKELKAIKLRGFYDPKRFYKGNDSKKLPTHFHIAREVGGGLAATGEHSTMGSGRKAKSFLDTVLADQAAQDYTWKRHYEATAKNQSWAQGGHGKRDKKSQHSSKRGGSWKKTKKS